MVVKHPELLAAQERMRRLRADPEKRRQMAARQRELRNAPENAERERERRARRRSAERARRESDPEYRKMQNLKSREYANRRLRNPEYRKLCNQKQREYRRSRIEADPEYGKRLVAISRAYKKAHPEKLIAHKRRRRQNPKHRAVEALRKAAVRAVKVGQKKFRSSHYLGIGLGPARQHIESMLRPGWTWENHGKVWEIDHIYPVARANINDPVERLAVSNYRNLRPLMAAENRSKKDKVTLEAMLLFEDLKREIAATLAAECLQGQ